MTEYVLLIKQPSEDGDPDKIVWRQIGATYNASSGRRALAAADVAGGEWVAVPARSFSPLTVKREQIDKVTIG